MEINKEVFGEQPLIANEQTEVEEQQENMVQDNSNERSPIHKFKTVDELAKAYERLEKEFTKKCQLVKQLENKEVSDNAIAPQYTLNDWNERVYDFFTQNPNAKQFVDEISNLLSSDKDIACSNNSLELAYGKVLANAYKTNQQLIKDENFVAEYVLKDEKIKQKIIDEYLKEISNKKTIPLMSGGGNSAITPSVKPNNVAEAGKIARALFKI